MEDEKPVFSQDHKIIAKQYLFTGVFRAILKRLLSMIFRLQPGFSEMYLDWIRPLPGSWITQEGKLDPEFYLAMITMHETIMIFFVHTAGLSGTFANFLIPLQCEARDMASGFITMLSYWFFFLSSVIMFISFFPNTGPAAEGWTI
jgi:cytochrome c oxidase subunit I